MASTARILDQTQSHPHQADRRAHSQYMAKQRASTLEYDYETRDATRIDRDIFIVSFRRKDDFRMIQAGTPQPLTDSLENSLLGLFRCAFLSAY